MINRMVNRLRSKTPTRVERKQQYILKKFYKLTQIMHDKNLNLYVNVTEEQILKEENKKKLDSIKNQLLFLIRLANIYI